MCLIHVRVCAVLLRGGTCGMRCVSRLFALPLTARLVRTDEESVCEMPRVLAYALLRPLLPRSTFILRRQGREQQEILLSAVSADKKLYFLVLVGVTVK